MRGREKGTFIFIKRKKRGNISGILCRLKGREGGGRFLFSLSSSK